MVSRGKGGRRGATCCALAWLVLLSAAPASADAQLPELWVFGNAENAGRIHLLIYGPPEADALVYEEIDSSLYPLRTVPLDTEGVGAGFDVARWHCGRRVRRFLVRVERQEGDLEARYETRTPSCRDRFALRLPTHARRGGVIRARIRDRWRIGGATPQLCVAQRRGRARCRSAHLPDGRTRVAEKLRLNRRGPSRVELRLLGYRQTRRYEPAGRRGLRLQPGRTGPSVLLVGDSMMLNINGLLKDSLRGRARTTSDVRVGSGLSKRGFNWVDHARRQAGKLKPDATVVFLGANDAFPMRTTAGRRVHCCGERWIAEYSRRVRKMMRLYARHGRAKAIWLTLPAPRLSQLTEPFAAVNDAIVRAARSTGAHVIKLDELFTPGFRWRAQMPVGGRTQRVRADDGIHLSIVGARLAAARVARELAQLGLL